MIKATQTTTRLADLTQSEIDALWDQDFRTYEVYVSNPNPVEYCGKIHPAGTIKGWDIRFIFSTRELLESFPFFDAIIGVDSLPLAECVWKGLEQ